MSTIRTRRVALGSAAGVALLGAVLAAGPAFAAPQGRITGVQSDGATVALVYSVTGLESGQSIDPASVQVSLGGQTLPSEAKPVGSGGPAPTAVLAMDVSGSMQGARLDAAKAAAKQFLATVPASTRVGLVTFATTAEQRVAPTTDRGAVTSVIDGLQAAGDTALYDATVLSTRAVGSTGPRTIVLFSDGADTSSRATLPAAAAAVRASGAVLDAVSLGTEADQVAALQTLARAGKGQVIATGDVNQLTNAFTEAARDISNQVTIVAQVPADLQDTSGNVTVTATAGGQQVSDSAFVSVPAAAAPTPEAEDFGPRPVAASGASFFSSLPVIALAALLLFAGLAVLLTLALRAADPEERREKRVTRKLSLYTLSGRGALEESQRSTDPANVARSAVDLANRVAVSRDFDTMLTLKLERGAVPLKAGEWMLLHLGIALGAAFLLALISGGSLLAALLGLLLGVLGPWLFLGWREERRRNAFQSQLPDTLQLISGSLSSGYSLPQAVDAVVRDSAPPMSVEFNRALVETRLGVPVEDALDGVASRMQSVDFSWVVMAIRIQREVGGNLAEVLTTVAQTMRERERLRRQVNVLSAEGRLSAVILGGLPIVFTLYLILVRPDYLRPLYTTVLGFVMIFVGVLLLVVGILWLRRSVKVEV